MIISRAPVRLSMGGGGTDLPSYYMKRGGFVMSVTINKFVYILINKRFQESIRLSYSETENVEKIDDIKHNIFRESLRFMKIDRQIEIVSVADVASNSGLGTSSAFTVSLLNGLYGYRKNYISLEKLAETACHIELDVLKGPIGKQDQYASAFGGFNAFRFNKDGTVKAEPVRIREEVLMELQSNIFLFYLNKSRSAGSILNIQNDKSKENDKNTIDKLDRIKEIGLQTLKIFENGNIDSFGEILHEHWLTKKKLSERVSDSYIDEAYDHALKNGALGGKVVGAGGGGFLLFYCPKNRSKFISAMNDFGMKPTWFNFEFEGAKKIYSS